MTALMIARMIADDPDEPRTSSGNESAGEAERDLSEKFLTDGRRAVVVQYRLRYRLLSSMILLFPSRWEIK